MDDLEFGDGEVEVGLVPERPADRGLQQQPAAMEIAVAVGRHRLVGAVDDQAQAAGEDRHAARLVDEIDGAAVERELLVVGLAVSREEHHRQVDARALQPGQQVDARDARQAPVEDDDLDVAGRLQELDQAGAVAERRDVEAVVAQFAARGLAEIVIVLHEGDAYAPAGLDLSVRREAWIGAGPGRAVVLRLCRHRSSPCTRGFRTAWFRHPDRAGCPGCICRCGSATACREGDSPHWWAAPASPEARTRDSR